MRVVVHLRQPAHGQRCDRALVEALCAAGHACTRSQLARAFAAGEVTASGKPLRPGRVVDRDLEVTVDLPRPEPLRAEPEALPLCVVHEDAHVIVVDKPAGMVVHAGPGHARGTLVNAVLHHLRVDADALPVMPGNDAARPGVVHRLDKDTSGLLVMAKTMTAQEVLARQFREHTLERAYLGIIAGVPTWSELRIETGHGRDPTDRRRFAPIDGGRRAITRAQVVRPLQGAALVRFVLQTGRTHQIRMHARHVGHPILGDALYGRRTVEGLGRHALHAAVLGFELPDGKRVRFESALPGQLRALVDELSAG